MPYRKKPPGKKGPGITAAEYERQIALAAASQHYEFCLYVAGTGPLSTQAIENISMLCHEHLEGRYHLKVIDIHQQPEAVADAQIIAAPTLIKTMPPPTRKFIGNLARRDRVMRGLNMIARPAKVDA